MTDLAQIKHPPLKRLRVLNPPDHASAQPGAVYIPRLAAMSLLCAFSVLPLSIFLPSLPNIAADFQTSYALVAISLAGYTALAAIVEIIVGPISDRFGRRPALLVCLITFIIGSIGCAMSNNIWSFLGFRLLQAPVTSAYPIAMAIIKDTTRDKQLASRIGYAAMAAAIAPMIGPAVGGVLDETSGWRAVFWFLAGAGVMMIAWCWVALPETNAKPTRNMKEHARSYMRIVREHKFWAFALCMAFSTGTFYAFLTGMPLAVRIEFGTEPALLGVLMGLITVGFFFGSFLAGRYSSHFPITVTLLAGRIVAVFGPALALGLFLSGFHHVAALFIPCMLVGIGNGLTAPSANAGAMNINPELAGSISGLAGAVTIAGGAALASITGLVVSESNAVFPVLGMMFLSATAALAAGMYAHYLDRKGISR